MEKQEKIDKAICALNAHINDLKVYDDEVDYHGENVRIEIYKCTIKVPRVTIPQQFFGFKLWDKVVEKSYLKRIAKLTVRINGSTYFSEEVDLEIFNEIYTKAKLAKEAKQFNEFNKLCNG